MESKNVFVRAEFIMEARRFAEKAHGNQRYGGQPYVFHLDQVAYVLTRFNRIQPEIQAAAFLHDTLEDTATNYNDILKPFGQEVAELVYAVTDEIGRNRLERHEKTYPKIAAFPEAIPLKLADRIANVEHSIRSGDGGKLDMYRREHPRFMDHLAAAGGPIPMWDRLAALLKMTPFKAPNNCDVVDADLACMGCGNRRGSRPYCLVSEEVR